MSKKVILLTGASSGIGREAAIYLANQGHIVYAAARRVDKLAELEKYGIFSLPMDVTDDKSMRDGVRAILAREDRIDVLINNAGYGSYGALEDVPMEEARKQVEVNLLGLARLTQLVVPQMRERRNGTIINVSSIGGRFGEPHGVWYHATKFALEGLSDSLRMELKQFGINVVVVQPGAILSEWASIATKGLLETSGDTAYGKLAAQHANMLRNAENWGSKPVVIAKVLQKAIAARRPRPRYVAGAGSCTGLFLRRILSDRMMDRAMLGMIRLAPKS